jgi:hypothetical protein
VQNWIADDDGIFALVLLHTICISIQGTINSIVYCYDESILSHCSISGLIAGAKYVVSRDKGTMELRPYELQHEEKDEGSNRNSVDFDSSPDDVRRKLKPDMENTSLEE